MAKDEFEKLKDDVHYLIVAHCKYKDMSMYDRALKQFQEDICERFHTFGYFKTESDARKSIKLFGDEIIELFVKSEGGENENNQRNKRR